MLAEEASRDDFAHIAIHLGHALVEAIAENRPYDGTLNAIQVPVQLLRQITVELVQMGVEEVGLEALLLTIKGRMYGSDLD